MGTINFGIDLGTTNSAIARFSKGKVEICKNPTSWKDTCPSVVGFRKDRILIGDAARIYQEKDPKNVVGQFKRKMGTTESYRIKSLDSSKTPVELSAQILKELKTFVQSGEKIEAAVVTIPASFDGIQSNATKQSAKDAGFKQVVLLQEPIAASLAYANQVKSDELADGKWLVYDLGGGTFDVALVKIQEGEMKILDHEGDNFLGGVDLDRLIVEHLIVPFLNENFIEISLENDLQSASGKYNSLFYKLLREAENAKIQLSNKSSAEIEFEFEDEEVFINITRSEFENLLREPIDRTAQMIKNILTRNSLTPNEIDFVLMVGGSTYIPYVRNRVGELLQIPVKTDIDPTTAIAIGAAYFAGTKDLLDEEKAENIAKKHNVLVRAVFEKATKETEELFVARISGDFKDLFYRISRMDGGFNTGLRKVSERITEDLPLVKDTYNYFAFTLLDRENNEIAANFNEFQIAHNIYTVYGQPLTDDISVELDNVETGSTYLKQVFSKNSILPLKSQVHTVTVTRPVKKGADDDILHISVYEGNSRNLPESNKHWGRLSINGSRIERDLIKGTEIELSFLLSESHDLSVTAYIPYTEQTFEQIFSPKEREVEIDWLQGELENLEERVDSEIDAAIDREDAQLKQEMTTLSNEVSRLREKADGLADDDETDTKFQIDNEKMFLAQKINAALQDRESAFLLEQYYEIKEKCRDVVVESGKEQNQKHFDDITATESVYINPPSPGHLKTKIGELEGLYHSILWRQPQFLTNIFNSIAEKEKEFTDFDQAQRLIREGQISIIDGQYDTLREIIFGLLDLLKRERRHQYDGKTGIG